MVCTCRKSVALPEMKHLLKDTFPLQGKAVFLRGRKSKETVSANRKWSSFKLVPPNFNNNFQQQKESSELNHTVSTRQKIIYR